MTTEDNGNSNKRPPDMILKAAPSGTSGEPSKWHRVGAAWVDKEKDLVTIHLDSFIVLQGRPAGNISLVLVPSRHIKEKGE